jgi:hypothetical protein
MLYSYIGIIIVISYTLINIISYIIYFYKLIKVYFSANSYVIKL